MMEMLAAGLAMAAMAPSDTDCAGAAATVEAAYVDGIWRNRDAAAVAAGFHPQFVMQARRNGELVSMSIDDWVGGRMNGTPNPDTVDARLTVSQCNGDTASVRVDLSVNGQPRFVDVLGLYRFDGNWQIVTKIYEPQ